MEKKRLEVVQEVANQKQSVAWAAAKLRKSERTIKRYVARIKTNSEETLVHKNSGRIPTNKKDHEQIWKLYCEKYYGMNILYFCESLAKLENIHVSEGTVRTIFKKHDEFSVQAWRRTKKELRKRLDNLKKLSVQHKEVLIQLKAEPYLRTTHPTQPRCKYFGEEIQMNASNHLWFAQRKSHLHLTVDDATGMIVGAYFDWQETRSAYYQITKQFLTEYGVPVKIKTDKRTVFEYKRRHKKDMAEDTMTQYQHVCQTLGIALECSSIPQFKPRVERCYKTLQGRLPFELKRAGVTTLEQANEFLPNYVKEFNYQFAICDGIPSCWATQVTQQQIEKTLVTFTKRVVDMGNGITLNNTYYGTFDACGNQVFITPKTRVSVITTMDGCPYVMHSDTLYAMDVIPVRQKVSKDVDIETDVAVSHKKYIPPFDSTWRITNANLFRKKACYF